MLLHLLLVACAAAGCSTLCDETTQQATDAGTDLLPSPPGVYIMDLSGTIELQTSQAGVWQKASEAQVVSVGDAIRSGSDGRFVLVFPGGGKLEVKGSARLALDGVDKEIALLMDEGEVEVQATPPGERSYRVTFGDPDDMVILREGRIRIKREQDEVQVRLMMGSARIRRGDEELQLVSGKGFSLQIGKGRVTGREALPTELRDRRRAARIQPPGAKRFMRPRRKRQQLETGTRIRTTRRAPVELRDESGNRVVIAPNSRVLFEGNFRSGTGREGRLVLDRGLAEVRLRRAGESEATQEIATSSALVQARALGLTTDMDVASRGKNTSVTVHAGEARVMVEGHTVAVTAGNRLVVNAAGNVDGPRRLAAPRMRAREGVRTRVYYDRRVPDVQLAWRRHDAPVRLEVTNLPRFNKLFLQEPVDGNRFSLRGLHAGRYRWRVVPSGKQPGSANLLVIQKDPFAHRRHAGKLTNVVPDTGIQTTILFQGKVPVLRFKWDPVDGAAGYTVKIYQADDMENPVLQREVNTNRLKLPAGQLDEGTYFWYQAARNEQGEDIKASQMNKLVLSFDNAAPLLRIDSPRTGSKPRGNKVRVRGLAVPGASVLVNGHPLDIGADGRFDQVLKGVARRSTLVFEVVKKGLGKVYFTRSLGG